MSCVCNQEEEWEEGGRGLREIMSLYIYGRKPELWGCENPKEKLDLVKQRSGWLGVTIPTCFSMKILRSVSEKSSHNFFSSVT